MGRQPHGGTARWTRWFQRKRAILFTMIPLEPWNHGTTGTTRAKEYMSEMIYHPLYSPHWPEGTTTKESGSRLWNQSVELCTAGPNIYC